MRSVLLYDASLNPIVLADGAAIPAGTGGVLIVGSDGANARRLLTDASGRQVVAGPGVAGTPAGGVISMQGVSGGTPLPVELNGGAVTTSTIASVAQNAASVTLHAANANRRGLIIWNNAQGNNDNLFIKFGATASTTSFTIILIKGSGYEFMSPIYRGIVDGIWSNAGTGAALVTELT